MTVTYEMTFDDYVEQAYAHARQPGAAAGDSRIDRWLGYPAVAAGTLLLAHRLQNEGDLVGPALIAAIGWIIVIHRCFAGESALRRMWNNSARLLGPQRWTIEQGGLTLDSELYRVRYLWVAFTHFVETRNLLLLYQTRDALVVVAKRAFDSPEQLAEFRSLLCEHIPPRVRGFQLD